MLSDFTGAERVCICCGYTDLRKGIDGLSALVQLEFDLYPFSNTLFLFCGRRRDRIKALYWEGNGFVLLYKRLESGSFQGPCRVYPKFCVNSKAGAKTKVDRGGGQGTLFAALAAM